MWALGGPVATTTAPARYYLTIDPEAPWPGKPPNSETAFSLETSLQFSQVGGGPATTTRAPAPCLLTIYSESPWSKGPRTQERRSRSRLSRNSSKLVEAHTWRQGSPIDVSP
eukprot:725110-Pyramimonas_sp.AAC.1